MGIKMDSEPKKPHWIEYAKLGVSIITPLMTGVIALLVLQLGTSIETHKQLNQELLKKRIEFYSTVAPKLDDIYCFYQGIGNWADLNPKKIISHKRDIDKNFHVYRYLFAEDLFVSFRDFEKTYFDTFSRVGKSARLRVDAPHLQKRIGDKFDPLWNDDISTEKKGNAVQQVQAYKKLMTALGNSIREPQQR